MLYTLPKIVFIHIPKTAGSSFRQNVLFYLYGQENVVSVKPSMIPRQERNTSIKNNKLVYLLEKTPIPVGYDKCRVIEGHITLSTYEHLKRINITFFRDPVERVISHYSHFNRSNIFKGVPILKFAKLYSNLASRQVGNDLSKLDFVGITEYYNKSVEKLGKFLNIDIPINKKKFKAANRKKFEPTNKERQIIKELNKKDYILYNEALQIWKGQ